MNDIVERRRFKRASFQAEVRLDQQGSRVAAELIDISLRGALVAVSPDWAGETGDGVRLELRLADTTEIDMDTEIAHVEGQHVGLQCRNIDLDSMTHLRRLIELNGGADLVDRELGALLGFDA